MDFERVQQKLVNWMRECNIDKAEAMMINPAVIADNIQEENSDLVIAALIDLNPTE